MVACSLQKLYRKMLNGRLHLDGLPKLAVTGVPRKNSDDL
jgi:hypothetical protein